MTVAHGTTYREHLDSWAEAVSRLNTTPDRIMIVTDDIIDAVDRTRELGNVTVIKKTHGHKHHPQVYVNEAIKRIDTDWICKMDVDDRIHPHALDPLEATEADVYMFGISHNNTNLPARHVTAHDILTSDHNLVFSGSPFRKWLTHRAKFRDMIYEDWAFWIECAKQNARFHPSPSIDYEYTMHDHNISQHVDHEYWATIAKGYR